MDGHVEYNSGATTSSGLSEHIIQNVVGCGLYQVLFAFAVYGLIQSSLASTVLMMSFGNYNPGWRCLDANDTTTDNSSSYGHSGGEVYIKDNCSLFTSCKNVQFSPEASTIVSEWGLLCDKAWIPSFIISIQMAGMIMGALVGGHPSDVFGRKTILFIFELAHTMLTIITIFSSSWEMFAALRFSLGLVAGGSFEVIWVFIAEMVTKKWRGPLLGAPHWSINASLFSLICFLTKNWRHIHIITAIISLVALIPALLLPESLRWLESKNKSKRFHEEVRKIAKINRRLDRFSKESMVHETVDCDVERRVRNLSIWTMFRGEHMKLTLLITLPWLSFGLIYYALAFGVKALSGDFYINLLLSNVIGIPFISMSMHAPNVLGRRNADIFFAGICSLSLVCAAFLWKYGSGEAQSIAIMALANLGKFSIDGCWGGFITHTVELYPTVVRGMAAGWGNLIVSVGSIAAPFLIPSDKDAFFTCYILMGVLACMVSVLMGFLPETKGKPLHNSVTEMEDGQQE